MPLVIQLYCPLPHSSLERVIYVFACPRTACQKKRVPRSPGEGPGCVRAWRANGWWREGEDAKLREKEERQQREREEKERAERKEAANQIHLGGLVFGGGGGGLTPGPGLVPTGAPFNPFATAAATPAAAGGGAVFNPFAVPSAPAAAVSSNPFALPGLSHATTATTTTTNSSAGANPFAALPPATASAPAPAAVSDSDLSENHAAATNSALQDDNSSEDQIISTWPPVASTSSSPPASTPTPVFRPQYVATLYEPSSSSVQASKGKGQRREDELARAFEAELAIRNGGENAESGRGGGQSKTAAKDYEADYLDDEEDRHAAARPGKGSGGRVKKGAERASASKKPSAGGGGVGDWAAGEGYEVQRVKGVDDIFLRFQERVSREGRQIVRCVFRARTEACERSRRSDAHAERTRSPPYSYDFGAAPLPYSSSSTAYKLVHPPVATNSDLGTYAASRLPPCRHCRGASTFELQLMPHLALELDERYEWASVWVLSCEAECPGGVADGAEAAAGEAWREERVLVEWEDEGA